MNRVLLIFGDNWIGKRKFHHSNYLIDINNVDFDEKFLSNKVSFGLKDYKYFLGYKDSNNVKPLCIILSKMIGYAKKILMKLSIFLH